MPSMNALHCYEPPEPAPFDCILEESQALTVSITDEMLPSVDVVPQRLGPPAKCRVRLRGSSESAYDQRVGVPS